MKRQMLLLLAVCVFFYGCKKETPAPAQKPAAPPAAASASAARDCKFLADNLPKCTPFSCVHKMEMFGSVISAVFTVKGIQDRKCILVQEAESDGEKSEVMTCALGPAQSGQLAAYYKIFFESKGNISVSGSIDLGGNGVSKEIIDGKEVINPLNEFLAKGICKMAGMDGMDEQGMEVELPPGGTMEMQNPDGSVTRYTGGADGKTTKQIIKK